MNKNLRYIDQIFIKNKCPDGKVMYVGICHYWLEFEPGVFRYEPIGLIHRADIKAHTIIG